MHPEPEQDSGSNWTLLLLLVCLLVLLAAVAIPNFVRARVTSAPNSCINNLMQIEGAKEQWALEKRKTDGEPAHLVGVVFYLKNSTLPECPAGGSYTIGNVGTAPRCSVPGHTLPLR